MNILLSVALSLMLHQPVVIPSCCPVMTAAAARVVLVVKP